jgi:hypothetical protein
MRLRLAVLLVAMPAASVSLIGCGGAGGRSAAQSTAGTTPATPKAVVTTAGQSATGAGALQAEAASAAAGDIPDDQVFLTFRNVRARYVVKYPEGWAQQGSGDSVTFRDKNNVIRAVVAAGPAWTRASVHADARGLKGAQVQGSPHPITLSGRPAFKVVYRTVSAANPVTGKRVTLSVDRYYLSRAGRRAVLDLACPVGVDNVDAYRLISESFRWS